MREGGISITFVTKDYSCKVRTLFLSRVFETNTYRFYFYHSLRTFSFIHMIRRVLRDNFYENYERAWSSNAQRVLLNNKCG